MDTPLIVEIHLIITPNRWGSACAKIAAVLRDRRCADFSLVALYMNSDIEDTELRICAQVKDPARLGEFVAKKIRSIKGVESARVRLTLQGEIFPEGVKVLTAMSGSRVSCHIFVNSLAGRDERVWRSLRRLKKDGSVLPVWIFRDFYEYDRDITLRVIGREEELIRRYVDKNVGSIAGIVSWRLKFMRSSVKILGKNDLLAIARNWFAGPLPKAK